MHISTSVSKILKIKDYDSLFFTNMQLTQSFVELYILLTYRKHLHARIISLRGEVWPIKLV